MKDSVYFLWDVITLGKGVKREINGCDIYFPAKWSRYFEADYEKENVDFIKAHGVEGMTFVDIGAHLGLISVIAAKIAKSGGKVYAFEPTPSTFQALNRIVKINGLSEVILCINMAVSDKTGEANFLVDAWAGSNANSLVERPDKERKAVRIPTIQLDSFVETSSISRIDMIKIDVEGAELSALRGAMGVLRTLRPRVILALHPFLLNSNGDTLEHIYEFIDQLSYDILYRGEVLAKEKFCGNGDFFDVHLVPR